MEVGSKKTMSNAKQWERTKQACRLCGQFIQNDEHYYMIVVPFPWAKSESNFIVHDDEWEPFREGMDTPEALFSKLAEVKQKRAKNKTVIDEKRIEAFKRVLSKRNCRIKSETGNTITFKDPRESAQMVYDKRFGTLDYRGRSGGGLGGLFNQMFTRENQARLLEEVEREMGNHVEDGFRVSTVVDRAMDQVGHLLK